MIDEKLLLKSRPEALNDKMDMELQNQKGGYNNGWNDCLFYFIDIIKRQPKVGEWIPFTFDEEGVLNCELPDIDEDILVWDMDGTFDKENVWVDTWESPDVGVYELESGMDLEAKKRIQELTEINMRLVAKKENENVGSQETK